MVEDGVDGPGGNVVKRPRLTLQTSMASIAAIAVLLAIIVSIPPSMQGTNCGGNTAAAHDVRSYFFIAENSAAESPDRQFVIDTPTAHQREMLSQITTHSWNQPARFLVARAPYRAQQSGPPRLLIVCESSFTNVPQRWLWPAPPRHAAAYTDGTVRLISTAEFAAIDRSLFVSLDEVLAASNP